MAVASLLTAGNATKSILFNGTQPVTIECPKCTAEYNNCTAPLHEIYVSAVGKAADSLNRDKISQLEYSKLCSEARKVRNEGIVSCTTTYNKCCLAETKAEFDKTKKKSSSKPALFALTGFKKFQ